MKFHNPSFAANVGNLKAYRDNFDAIFRKGKTPPAEHVQAHQEEAEEAPTPESRRPAKAKR